jgi:hypothetical protein
MENREQRHTSSLVLIFAFELGESPASISNRFIDLSTMEGVEAGLGLLELRSGGVL